MRPLSRTRSPPVGAVSSDRHRYERSRGCIERLARPRRSSDPEHPELIRRRSRVGSRRRDCSRPHNPVTVPRFRGPGTRQLPQTHLVTKKVPASHTRANANACLDQRVAAHLRVARSGHPALAGVARTAANGRRSSASRTTRSTPEGADRSSYARDRLHADPATPAPSRNCDLATPIGPTWVTHDATSASSLRRTFGAAPRRLMRPRWRGGCFARRAAAELILPLGATKQHARLPALRVLRRRSACEWVRSWPTQG